MSTLSHMLSMHGKNQEPPPSYTCLSCFVFIFCCWPIGLYAIVMSSTVQTRLENNDFEVCSAGGVELYHVYWYINLVGR